MLAKDPKEKKSSKYVNIIDGELYKSPAFIANNRQP
jgi:hypothetical protein